MNISQVVFIQNGLDFFLNWKFYDLQYPLWFSQDFRSHLCLHPTGFMVGSSLFLCLWTLRCSFLSEFFPVIPWVISNVCSFKFLLCLYYSFYLGFWLFIYLSFISDLNAWDRDISVAIRNSLANSKKINK